MKIKKAYNRIIKHDNMLYFFTKGTKYVNIFNLVSKKSRTLKFNDKIYNISVTANKIAFYSKNYINVLQAENLKVAAIFVFKNILDVFYLDFDSYIFFDGNNAYFHNDSGMFNAHKLIYYQIISPFAILVYTDKIEIYQENTLSPIFVISKVEFCSKFELKQSCEFFDEWSDQMYFSIRNNKLYTKINDRVLGVDLNLYLDDLKKYKITNIEFNKFLNIKNQIIFFNKKEQFLLITEKNLMHETFRLTCKDFVYDETAEKLYALVDKNLIVFQKINIYQAAFTLIDTYIKYDEREDEFDESCSEINDF